MTEQPLDELERHRAELYAQLAGTGDFRPGSVNETWRRCGPATLRLRAAGSSRSRAAVPVDPVGGLRRRVPGSLASAELGKVRREIENYRQFRGGDQRSFR